MTQERQATAAPQTDGSRCVNASCEQPVEGPRCTHCGCATKAGRWTVQRLISQSAHSRVYLARDAQGQVAALKELHFALVPGAKELDAFEHEGKTLASIQNASVPRFIERFTEGTGVGLRLYLASEYVQGESLAERIARGPMPEEDVKAIGLSLLRILRTLQQRSPALFHRDLKPANVMFRESAQGLGAVVLVDFGSARTSEGSRTHRSTLVGTFGYMPPEQLGGTIDRTTDVFALAATLLHALTGRPPADLMQADFTPAIPSSVSPALASWLRRALAFDPRQRFPDASSALEALQRGDVQRPARPVVRAGFLAAFAAVSVAFVGFVLGGGFERVDDAPALIAPRPIASTGEGWFAGVKSRCNQLEVNGVMARTPPPAGSDGAGYGAGCYALAGKYAEARKLIETLPDPRARTNAAWRVFEIAHPVADQGEDSAAGPMMELVIDYWPENFQALYHAGISEYAAGDTVLAKKRLEQFLELYNQPDHFTQTAKLVLERIEKGLPADPSMGLGRH